MINNKFPKILTLLVKKLNKVPEMSETIKVLTLNKGIKKSFADSPISYSKVICFDYLGIIRYLINLSDDDLILIKKVNKIRNESGLDTNPLGQHGVDIFYEKVDKANRELYWQTLISNFDANSEIFKRAVNDLSKRMMFASKLAKKGVVLKDGDPRADKVIWGHTKGITPEATIHFIICHLIDRLTYQIFLQSQSESVHNMIKNKHYLFDPFGDIVFLLSTKKMINRDIAEKWMLGRESGGLKWNTQEEQKVFDKEYRKQK